MELELKYRAADDDVLEQLARVTGIGPARLDAPRAATEIDRYLDTPDRRLAAARWACRLRIRDGVTIVSLKGPAVAAVDTDPAALHRRPEIEAPATAALDPAAWPPSLARERLASLSGGEPLREWLRLEQRRTERAVIADGARVGMLSIDRVEMWRGATRLGRLRIVELELDPVASVSPALVVELDRALRAVPGLEPDARTKLEHALAAAELA